jgi:hypothetical protein
MIVHGCNRICTEAEKKQLVANFERSARRRGDDSSCMSTTSMRTYRRCLHLKIANANALRQNMTRIYPRNDKPFGCGIKQAILRKQ